MKALFSCALILAFALPQVYGAPVPSLVQKRSKKVSAKKKKVVKKKPVVKVVSKTIDPLNQPVVGTWYLLDSERKYVKMTKIIFSKYGEFTFMGSAWKSAGTFRFRDSAITLNWKSVDGQAVKYGSMKKVLPVFEGAKLIQLDRFQYGKAN